MTVNEDAYQTPNGESVVDRLAVIYDYPDMTPRRQALFDVIIKNSATLVASKLPAPNMFPPPERVPRDQPLIQELLEIFDETTAYIAAEDKDFFVSIHPSMNPAQDEFIYIIHLIELKNNDQVSSEDIVATTYIVLRGVGAKLQEQFMREYASMLQLIEDNFGKSRADMIKMTTSNKYVNSLAALVTSGELFFSIHIPKKG